MPHGLLRRCLPALFVVAFACGAPKPDDDQLGVFVGESDQVVELTEFGEKGEAETYTLPHRSKVPAVSQVDGFFVNLPEAVVSSCRVYRTDQLEEAFREKDGTLETVKTERVKGSLYKLSSPGLQEIDRGFLVFKVGMKAGMADRIYPVRFAT